MKRSSAPRKTANLSESIHQQLNMYALAAGAAGVSVLALSPPGEAKIVYTPANKYLTPNHSISLDLNHDGTIDFLLRDAHFMSSTSRHRIIGSLDVVAPFASQVNGIVGYSRSARHYSSRTHYYASALQAGVFIGPKRNFIPFARLAYVSSGPGARRFPIGTCIGPWVRAKNRYLGLEFFIEGKIHFGWARLNAHCRGTDVFATLTGYAYETIPVKSIIAGATKGPGDIEPTASFAMPTPQPVTLGALALGAPGLAIWRRKESSATALTAN
jgi:hypothetical protein